MVTTIVDRVEVDGTAVKADYKVICDAGNFWIEAKRTEDGFVLPEAIAKLEWINFVFEFADHRLLFEKIHISKFGQVWNVGADGFPFSEEYVPKKDAKRTLWAYYIEFTAGHGTRVIVSQFKTRTRK